MHKVRLNQELGARDIDGRESTRPATRSLRKLAFVPHVQVTCLCDREIIFSQTLTTGHA